jgi:hypothetical protein
MSRGWSAFLCLIYRSFKKGAENHGGTDSHYG